MTGAAADAATGAAPDAATGAAAPVRGLLVVGHGSRRSAANDVVRVMAGELAERGGWWAVQAAFLELAGPSIADGVAALVREGCDLVVVHPFFLVPGTHTATDIPAALEAAAGAHPGLRWVLTEPLGGHPGLVDVVTDRITAALAASAAPAAPAAPAAAPDSRIAGPAAAESGD